MSDSARRILFAVTAIGLGLILVAGYGLAYWTGYREGASAMLDTILMEPR